MNLRAFLMGLFLTAVASAVLVAILQAGPDPALPPTKALPAPAPPAPVASASNEVRLPVVFWATVAEEEALRIVADAEGASGVTTTYSVSNYWQQQIQPVFNFLRARADQIERTNRISAVGEQIKALSREEFGSLQNFLDSLRPRMSGPLISSTSTNTPPSPPAQ